MKTIYFLLLTSFALFANNPNNENPKPAKSNIYGLKIVSYESKVKGKHIYVVSEIYSKKKITITDEAGKKVYETSTFGSAIYLSYFKKGNYKMKIQEGTKIDVKDLVIE
jgi:hypothetical protein